MHPSARIGADSEIGPGGEIGAFARVGANCRIGNNVVIGRGVEIGKQEGRWKPWWHAYRVETVGWTPKKSRASVEGKIVPLAQMNGRWGVTVPVKADAMEIAFE